MISATGGDARRRRALCQVRKGPLPRLPGRLKLDQINDGFARLKSGAPVRQLIDFAA
jgi:Zn-dependent alcohol dehydrogenase